MTAVENDSVSLPRNYLRPCLLLLLAEGTSHGYELLAQVADLGVGRVDPGAVYRCLRAMDEDGLVHSSWEPSASGPARRVYALTDRGHGSLDALAASVGQVARSLNRYHRRYAQVRPSPHAVR